MYEWRTALPSRSGMRVFIGEGGVLMAKLDHGALVTLAGSQGWPALSLYMPTHRVGAEKQQDPTRLKNLLRSAYDKLVADGMRTSDADAFCAPVSSLIDNQTFWRESSLGLAAFVSAGGVEIMRLDATVPEQAIVGDRFYLRPLLATHRGDRRFFALTVDRAGCELYQGDGATIEQITLEGVPTSLADEMRFDETSEPSVQHKSFPPPQSAALRGRGGRGTFHGHGGETLDDKNNLDRYLRKIEGAVAKTAACEADVPLVLLGVDYTLARYRLLNTCSALVEEQVFGATDELAPHEIHAKVLMALEGYFAREEKRLFAELADQEGSGLVSHDPAHIVSAAAEGRVKELFFDDSVGPFGTFDRSTLTVETVCSVAPRYLREGGASTGDSEECGWDLVDLAAAETVLNGGDVHAFTGENAPVNGVTAVMRY